MNQSLPTQSLLLPRWKLLTFALTSISLGLLFSLTAAEIILNYQRQYIENSDHLEAGMILFDKQLGWRLSPDWQGSHHHYDFDTHYQISGLGFRGANEQAITQKEEIKRFAIIGDSFTFGTGVNNADTFTQQLNTIGDAGVIFSNYGIPGYSTDQEYLLFERQIKPLQPDHLIVIVYLPNDLFDNELAFPMQAENGKPWFKLDDNGQLQQQNIPVPMQSKPAAARKNTLQHIVMGEQATDLSLPEQILGQLEIFRRLGLFQHQTRISKEHFQQRFDYTLRLFFALISEIQTSCEQINCKLSIALLPGRSYVIQPDSISGQYQAYLGQKINQQLESDPKIQLIDLASPLSKAYQEEGETVYFPNEGHLNKQGHRIVAQEIFRKLQL